MSGDPDVPTLIAGQLQSIEDQVAAARARRMFPEGLAVLEAWADLMWGLAAVSEIASRALERGPTPADFAAVSARYDDLAAGARAVLARADGIDGTLLPDELRSDLMGAVTTCETLATKARAAGRG